MVLLSFCVVFGFASTVYATLDGTLGIVLFTLILDNRPGGKVTMDVGLGTINKDVSLQ